MWQPADKCQIQRRDHGKGLSIHDITLSAIRNRNYINSSQTGGDMLLTQPPQTHNMPALSKCIISVVLVHT